MKNAAIVAVLALLLVGGCKPASLEGKWETHLMLDGKQMPIHVDMHHDGTWTGEMKTESADLDGTQLPKLTIEVNGTWNLDGENLTFVTKDTKIKEGAGMFAVAGGLVMATAKTELDKYQVTKVKFPDPTALQVTNAGGDSLTFHRE